MRKRTFSIFGVVAVGHFALSVALLAYMIDVGFMHGGGGEPGFVLKALGLGTWLLLLPVGLFGSLPMLALNSLLWGAGAVGVTRLWQARRTRGGAA